MLKPKSFIPVITFVLVMMYGFSGAQELVPNDEMGLVIVVVHPEGKPNGVGENVNLKKKKKREIIHRCNRCRCTGKAAATGRRPL